MHGSLSKRGVAIVAVITAVFAGGIWFGSTSRIHQLAQKLEWVVYHNDFDPDHIDEYGRKWMDPIRIRIHGISWGQYRPLLTYYIDQLRALTGLDIREVAEDGEQPNLNLHFTSKKAFIPISKRYEPASPLTEKEIDSAICFVSLSNYSTGSHIGGIYRGYILLPLPLPPTCLLEELTQSLGLIADTDLLQPSIFSEKDNHLIRLTFEDKLLVRTYYDERIKLGMPKHYMLETARTIFRELLAATEQKGEDALIHPNYTPVEPVAKGDIKAYRARLEREFEAAAREVWGQAAN